MANIPNKFSSAKDEFAFWKTRADERGTFDEIVPRLQKKGLAFVGENIMWQKPAREWKNRLLKKPLLVLHDTNAVYYDVIPIMKRGQEPQEKTLHSGYFTLQELRMFLQGKGPIIDGTPEQQILQEWMERTKRSEGGHRRTKES